MASGYLANSFDLLNVRDLDLIDQARGFCSRLVVGVLDDDFAAQLYGRRPVVPLAERMTLVAHVRGVDEVVVHGADGAELAPGDVVFTVAGDAPVILASVDLAPVELAPEPVLLTPRRASASTALRAALEPIARDEVA